MTSASDGLEPWRGKAGDIRVGHLIQGSKKNKNDVWRVIDMANPDQIEFAYTLWIRVENVATGEIVPVPPRTVVAPVFFMLTPEELELAELHRKPPSKPYVWPVDSDATQLLVEQLGAQHIATRDNETGEITCPQYAAGYSMAHGSNYYGVEELEHLRLCHGIDTAGLEAMEIGDDRTVAIGNVHGREHSGRAQHVGRGGFPHRHVPEDRSLL